MNNNQQNQAMGVLGGLTGFAIVANMADGKNVVTIMTDFEQALYTLDQTVSGLPTVAFKHIKDSANNQMSAATAADTFNVEGTNDVTVSVDAVNKKITVSGQTLKNAIASAVANIGNLSSLTTTDKSSLVAAVNELVTAVAGCLTTTAAASTYLAQSNAKIFRSVVSESGTRTAATSADTLTVKGAGLISTSVNGSNELIVDGSGLKNMVGDMSGLWTQFDSIVDALKELNDRVSALEE